VSRLPEAIHTGLSFFEACLEERVIIVPGEFSQEGLLILSTGLFFDINPKNRRDLSHSPCHHFIRYNLKLSFLTSSLSFGPPLEELKRGLDGIGRVLVKYGVHPTKK
jgi:hypothetical protein